MADRRPVPLLRAPRRRLSARATSSSARRRRSTAATSGRTSRASTVGACTTAQGVPGLPAAPAPRLRDGHLRAPGLHRPLRLARRHRPLRRRRRAVAHRRRAASSTAEMFPLLDTRRARTRSSCSRSGSTSRPPTRWSTPYFTMLWDEDIPRVVPPTTTGRATEITVIAGELGRSSTATAAARTRGRRGPTPTSPSGTLRLDAGRARGTLPAGRRRRHRPHALRVRGRRLRVGDHDARQRRTGASCCAPTRPVDADAGADGAEVLHAAGPARSASRWRSTARS